MNKLLEYLRNHKEDRGVMATLRCGLVENKRHRAYPILGWFGGIGNDHESRVKRTIAGLFATHQEESGAGINFGATCFALCNDEEKKEMRKSKEIKGPPEKPGQMAKRLQYLLAAEREEICDRVIRIVQMAKSKDIPVNYNQLYEDLQNWGREYWGEKVKTNWALAFWAPKVEVPEELPKEATP